MKTTNVNDLVKKWDKVLKEGNGLKNGYVEKSTALMLENQFNYMQEMSGGRLDEATTWSGDNVSHQNVAGDADFYKIAIPMVRRTFPELVAHDLVGVQPLNAPVGLAFALRYKADQAYNNVAGAEVGYNDIDPIYSGSGHPVSTDGTTGTALSGMTRPEGEELGSATGTIPDGVAVGSNIGLGVGDGYAIRELSMTIEKAQVEAKTRKLRSRWSLEIAQDLKYMHGLNIEEEMLDVLSYEITAEIDRELITLIRKVAGSNSESGNQDYTALDGRWEAEKYRNLYNLLIRKANTISISTRRGPGNWVVANPTVSAAFEALADFTIAPVDTDINTGMTGVAKIGTMGGRLTAYRDTFAVADEFLVGFKGASAYDTGIVYLPYIQLLVSKATFEDSFNPVVGLMSRYAIHEHMFGASNYYVRTVVQNMNTA